jgi:hypothetical protein
MRRDWTEIGKRELIEKREGEREPINQTEVEAAILNIEWQAVPCNLAMGPGLGIKEAIKQLRIPNVSHVADSHALAPYGLLGIFGHYANRDVRVYVLDAGDHLTPLCMDVEDKIEIAASDFSAECQTSVLDRP